MDDKVHIVDQHPFGLGVALDMGWAQSCGFEPQFDLIGNGLYLAGIRPAAQNKIIGKGTGTFFHLQDGKFFGFLIEAGLDGGVYLLLEITFS